MSAGSSYATMFLSALSHCKLKERATWYALVFIIIIMGMLVYLLECAGVTSLKGRADSWLAFLARFAALLAVFAVSAGVFFCAFTTLNRMAERYMYAYERVPASPDTANLDTELNSV